MRVARCSVEHCLRKGDSVKDVTHTERGVTDIVRSESEIQESQSP